MSHAHKRKNIAISVRRSQNRWYGIGIAIGTAIYIPSLIILHTDL